MRRPVGIAEPRCSGDERDESSDEVDLVPRSDLDDSGGTLVETLVEGTKAHSNDQQASRGLERAGVGCLEVCGGHVWPRLLNGAVPRHEALVRC